MKTWSRLAVAAVAVASLVCVGIGLASASAGDSRRNGITGASAETPAVFPPQPAAARAVPFRPARTENVFVSIAPCRIANTIGHGTEFAPNGTRRFNVRGTFGFAPQGGKSGGCGLPTYATSVVLTVNALSPTGSGYLLGYAVGTPVPTANFMAYRLGGTSSNPTLTLAAPGTEPSLAITNLKARTQVAIDVMGYYMPPIEGLIVAGSEPYQGSTRILGTVKVVTGVYNVTVEGDVSNCSPFVTPYYGTSVYATAYTYGTNIVRVYLWTLNSTGGPVAYNGYFYLTVSC